MLKNEIFGWLLKFWLIAVIGFTLFCLGRYFNHFPNFKEGKMDKAVTDLIKNLKGEK